MTVVKCLVMLALALGLCAICAPAQMPTDNMSWKSRCEALHAALPTATSPAPASFVPSALKNKGEQWTTFGWDRSRANQHAVACVFFYLGAIASQKAPAQSHTTRVHAKESWTMGTIEWKAMHGSAPTVSEKLTRDHAKLAEIPKPALTVGQEQTMVDTGRTLPIK